MARTTPWLFYQFFVRPNYADFAARPDDIRLGFNAALSAFQQADIFYAYYRRKNPSLITRWESKKALLIHLAELDANFLTVQSAATVYKHLYAAGGHYETGSPMALWGIVYPSEKTQMRVQWGGPSEGSVVVRRKDKPPTDLHFALKSVVENLWPNFLPPDYGTD